MLVYEFGPEWQGHVVAEDRNDRCDNFLEPAHLPFQVRTACDAVGLIFALQAGSKEQDAEHRHRLSAEYAPAEAFRAAASGVLAVPISQLYRSDVLWFRREEVRGSSAPWQPAEIARRGATFYFSLPVQRPTGEDDTWT